MKNFFLFALVLVTLSLFSCDDEATNPSDRTPAIYGRVLDKNGKPVKDAEVNVIFDMENFPNIKDTSKYKIDVAPHPFSDAAIIWFEISKKNFTTVSLFHSLFADTVAVILRSELQPGSHAVHINGELMSNGKYDIVIDTQDTILRRTIFHNNIDRALWTKSDDQGKFVINYQHLPIGESYPRTDIEGRKLGIFKVGDSLKVKITHANDSTFSLSKTIKVDKTKIHDLTIQ